MNSIIPLIKELEKSLCTKCNKYKTFNNFYKGYNKNGLRYVCKNCDSIHNKIYGKKYYKINKIQLLDYHHQHKNHRNLYRRKLNKSNIQYRIWNNTRVRLYQAIKGLTKSAHTLILIGCSIEQLKKHLEDQFQPGMSWSNYGEWHIDHIKPCTRFDLSKSKEQRKCFNYTNLQPLWAIDNMKKHNHYEKIDLLNKMKIE